MTVIKTKCPVERSLTYDVKAGYKGRISYDVETTSQTYDEFDITGEIVSGGGPTIGSAWPSSASVHSGILCKNISANSTDRKIWRITYDYDSEIVFPHGAGTVPGYTAPTPGNLQNNPTSRPPIWQPTARTVTIALDKDTIPVPIINTAGQPFLPPLTVDYTIPGREIILNKATFTTAYQGKYENTTNDDTFLGEPGGHWRCVRITGQNKTEHNVHFIEAHIFLELAPDQWPWSDTPGVAGSGRWYSRLLDAGLNEIKASGKLGPILDKETGQAIASPWPLDGAGHALTNPASDTKHWIPFQIYRPESWGGVSGGTGSGILSAS